MSLFIFSNLSGAIIISTLDSPRIIADKTSLSIQAIIPICPVVKMVETAVVNHSETGIPRRVYGSRL